MRLPAISKRLRELAAERGIPELAELADQMKRRPATSRAPRSSESMTPALRAAIVAHCRSNPSQPQAVVGRHFNVNPGRVSGALRGKRQ